jgi:hypothetical protein
MFTVKVPDLIIRQSQEIVRNHNFGMRASDTNGTKTQQLYGIIAQNSILFAYGLPLVKPSEGWDGGFDLELFGQRIDVKTKNRVVPTTLDYEASVVKEQIKYDVQLYLFTSLNTQNCELTICGWISKDDLLCKARMYKRGDVIKLGYGKSFVCRLDTYQVFYKQLNHQASDFDELKEELEIYSILR